MSPFGSCNHFCSLEDQCSPSALKSTDVASSSEGDSSVQAKFRKRGSQLWLDLRKVTVAITAFGLQKPAAPMEDLKDCDNIPAPPIGTASALPPPPPPPPPPPQPISDFGDIELHDVSDVLALETSEAGNPDTGTLASCRWNLSLYGLNGAPKNSTPRMPFGVSTSSSCHSHSYHSMMMVTLQPKALL